MDETQEVVKPVNATSSKSTKKTYETPRLVSHGSVQEVTQFIGVNPTDGLAGSLI